MIVTWWIVAFCAVEYNTVCISLFMLKETNYFSSFILCLRKFCSAPLKLIHSLAIFQ